MSNTKIVTSTGFCTPQIPSPKRLEVLARTSSGTNNETLALSAAGEMKEFPFENNSLEQVQESLEYDFGTTKAQSLGELLTIRTHESPDRFIYHFTRDKFDQSIGITYRQLLWYSSRIALLLSEQNKEKKPVLLLFNCGLDYILAFFACLLADQPAVPMAPPSSVKDLKLLQKTSQQLQSSCCLIGSDVHALIELIDDDRGNCLGKKIKIQSKMMLNKNTCTLGDREARFDLPRANGNSVAFIQQDSTNLTHRAVLQELKDLKARYQFTALDRLAMWLPLHHDSGFIGGLLNALYVDAPLYFMPPQSMGRPYKWLKLLSDVRATVSIAPPLALELCFDRISNLEMKELDLSSLRFISSGSEAFPMETQLRFSQQFEQAGLRSNIFFR